MEVDAISSSCLQAVAGEENFFGQPNDKVCGPRSRGQSMTGPRCAQCTSSRSARDGYLSPTPTLTEARQRRRGPNPCRELSTGLKIRAAGAWAVHAGSPATVAVDRHHEEHEVDLPGGKLSPAARARSTARSAKLSRKSYNKRARRANGKRTKCGIGLRKVDLRLYDQYY